MSMKDLKLIITINKPAKYLFDFTLNPANTPKWIDTIVVEETNEWPPKIGTIYRNKSSDGKWREFELTAFEPGKMFVLSKRDGYHVRYTFAPIDEDSTELEYYEWVDDGVLTDVLTMDVLEKLKQIVE